MYLGFIVLKTYTVSKIKKTLKMWCNQAKIIMMKIVMMIHTVYMCVCVPGIYHIVGTKCPHKNSNTSTF